MFSGNLTNDGLPKSSNQQDMSSKVLTDDILPLHQTVILKVAHYRTYKLMSIRFFVPGKKVITIDLNIPSEHHRRQRVPIEAKEETEMKLREMTVQDIITPQVECTAWLSLLSYF